MAEDRGARRERSGGDEGSSPGSARFPRRAFVATAAAGALALVLPIRVRPGSGLSVPGAASLAAEPKRFSARLPIPEVLRDAHIRLPIREAHVPILPGRPTKMWTYDGTFPGPTIHRRSGQRTKVTFIHHLPASAGELSVHLHGGHTRSRDDGQPGGLTASQPKSFYCEISPNLSARASGNDLLISPGERRTYVYELMEDGAPERAAFQWYHDHRLDHTGRNVWRGLAGMWILEDDFEAALPLPRGDHDIPLLIADRGFDRHNQLIDPFNRHLRPPDDGVTGRFVLVNGAYAPHHHVDARRYRLRLLNASNFRAYNFYLSNGAPLVQIATESGLMPVPVERDRVLLGPAERAEVIVDFSDAHGEDVTLRSGRRRDGMPDPKPRPFDGPVMQFRVGHRRQDSTSVPAALRPLPAWVAGASPAPDRTWIFSIKPDLSAWTINGNTFDPARVDAFPAIDTTETWELTNVTGVSHMVHMHSTDWYMLSRNGLPPPPWEDCLKETFFLDPGDSVRVAARFTDHLGKFVIHCHMLDHEDHGLMAQFEVVASAAAQPASDVAAKRRAGLSPAPQAYDLGLPDSASVRGARVAFTPRAPRGEELSRLQVFVDGELARTLSGSAIGRRVTVRGPRRSPFRVTVVGSTTDGRFLAAAREYRAPAG